MKKCIYIALSLLMGAIFTSCASIKEVKSVMNEVEAGELPILMVCPAPGQDFDAIFTKPDIIQDAEESYLEINTNVSGANVTINNQSLGITPLKVIKMPSGAFSVDVLLEGYEPFNAMINVNDNKGYKYSFTLTKKNKE